MTTRLQSTAAVRLRRAGTPAAAGWGSVLLLAAMLLGVPLAAWIYPGWAGTGKTELRDLAPGPQMPRTLRQLKHWPETFDLYFNDHIPARTALIRAWSDVAHFAGISSSSEVVLGKNGWLFLRRNSDIVDRHRGLLVPTDRQLGLWVSNLAGVFTQIESAGGEPWFVVVPDKEGVYPEFLPSWTTPIGPTATDLIMKALREKGLPHILDLRRRLVDAKPQGQLYWKTDTHWNGLGESVAYFAILNEWWPHSALRSEDEPKFIFRTQTFVCDLTRLLGGPAGMDESGPTLEIQMPRARAAPGYSLDYKSISEHGYRANAPGARAGKLLAFGDSFFEGLCPAIQESFRETVVFHNSGLRISKRLLAQEKATIVLIIAVERDLPLDGPRLVE